jgi:hypothetical protein
VEDVGEEKGVVQKGHIGHITVSCSAWERKRTPLWAGIVDALLEKLGPAGSVITARVPRKGVRFDLSDDLRGSPDVFLGNNDMGSVLSSVGDNSSAGLKLQLRLGEDEELFVTDGGLSSLAPEIQSWERS